MFRLNLKVKNPNAAWWSKPNKLNQRCQKILFWWLIFFLPTQLGKHFWFDFSYVLGLRLDYLSPTIYLTDILVLLILILWLFEKKINFKLNGYLLFIIIYLLANCFLATNRWVAFYKFLRILELFFLGLFVAKKKFTRQLLPAALSLAIIYSSLLAIGQFFCQSSLGGWFYWLGERYFNVSTPGIAKFSWQGRLFLRPYATFSHPNSLAGFLLVALILVIGKLGFWRWPVLALAAAAIFLSFSRTVWLVGGLMMVFYFVLRRTNAARRALHSSSIFWLTSASFWQRWDLIKAAWEMIKNKPFLGIGLGNFVVRLPDFSSAAVLAYWFQPVHNIFLLVAAETGLIGLMIFFGFIFKTLRHSFSPALLVILLTGLFDHYWLTLPQNQLLLAITLGLAWQSKPVRIKEHV